jgi:hypothetical protein
VYATQISKTFSGKPRFSSNARRSADSTRRLRNPNQTERTNYITFSKYTDPWTLSQFFLCNPTFSKLLQSESQCVNSICNVKIQLFVRTKSLQGLCIFLENKWNETKCIVTKSCVWCCQFYSTSTPRWSDPMGRDPNTRLANLEGSKIWHVFD